MSKAKQKMTAQLIVVIEVIHTSSGKNSSSERETAVCKTVRPDQGAGDIQKLTKVGGRYFGFRMESGNLC